MADFRAMIRGNVTRLSMPFGTGIIGISTEETPTVVGVTSSDSITGDYELDVAPYQGQCNVMAVPDYGREFSANTVFPLDTIIRPTTPNGYLYRITEAGELGAVEPDWPTTENQVITSGTVTMVTEIMLRPLVNSLITPVIEGLVVTKWFDLTNPPTSYSPSIVGVTNFTLMLPLMSGLYAACGLNQIRVAASLTNARNNNFLGDFTASVQDIVEYARGKFFTCNETDNTLYRIAINDAGVASTDGDNQTFGTGNVRGLAVNREDNKLYALVYDGTTPNLWVADVDPANGDISNATLAANLSGFSAATDALSLRAIEYRRGILFVSDRIDNKVHQLNAETYQQITGAPVWTFTPAQPTTAETGYKIKFDGDNKVLVTNLFNGEYAEYTVAPVTE